MGDRQIKRLANLICCPLFIIFSITLLFPACQQERVQPDRYQILKTPVPVSDRLQKERYYTLYLPAAKNKTIPMIVYFHGVMSPGFKNSPALKNYSGSPVEETGLIQFCKQRKIALLVPKTAYTFKFQHYKAHGWSPFEKESDGIEKMIDAVINKYAIDRKGVYLYGISAGAVLTHHLASRRPDRYNAILSHSQGYTTDAGKILQPKDQKHKFGVVICYTRKDYDNLIKNSHQTYENYLKLKYKAILLKNLPPDSHRWDNGSNLRFWNFVQKVGQYSGAKK